MTLPPDNNRRTPCDLDEVAESLATAIRQDRAILFVGAGVSMSVGLPSWQSLIDRLRTELDLNEDTSQWPTNNHQTLAEYYRIKKEGLEPLVNWMNDSWHIPPEVIRNSEVHRLIVSLDFPTIYTTNYDHTLESAYDIYDRPYAKIVSPKDMIHARPGDTQIIKFHGDLEHPESLVLTESDYFDRMSFTSPMDIKFRADVLENTVLFIGYSLSDLNIRLILHRLWQTWRHSGQEDHRPPSFVFMPNPDPVQEAVLSRWGVTMVTEDAQDAQAGLIKFLQRLKRCQ